MNGTGKFLVGLAGASLLAWGAHAVGGEDYINTLEERGNAALAEGGYEGVSLEMGRDPLSRGALLDGVTDSEKRAEIEAKLKAAGISPVRWASDADAADGSGEVGTGIDDAEATTGASEEQVADCQGSLDAFMEGKSINFESGSAYLAPGSLRIVDGLAERLTACTGMSVAVGGHTDATGTAAINDTLSQSRADSVAAALSERGVAANRITATGYGSSQPLVEGDGANAANRRIEFTLDAGSDAAGAAEEGGE